MRFYVDRLPLLMAALACSGCATGNGSANAQTEREIVSRYICRLEYAFGGGVMRASVKLNEDGSVFGRSQVRWEKRENGGLAPSEVDDRYRVLPPGYLLAWPVDEDGELNLVLGQIYVSRDIYAGDQTMPWPSHIHIGFRTRLDQPAFGNARFGADLVERQGSIGFYASLDEVLALARGGDSLYGVIIAGDGALIDYWPVDYSHLEAARSEAPVAKARVEAIASNYKEECTFIEDVEASRIYVTRVSQFRAHELSAGISPSRNF